MVVLSKLLLFLYLLSYKIVKSVDNPLCKWHTSGPVSMPVIQIVIDDLVQPIGTCGYSTFFEAYTKWDCISERELGFGLYSDMNCSVGESTGYSINDTDIIPFDCNSSLPYCFDDNSINIAKYRSYYDEFNCSNYYDSFIITDLCLKEGNGAWYIAKVFNDSVLSPREYDLEIIKFHDGDCSSQDACEIVSDEFSYYCPQQLDPLLSFNGSPELNADTDCLPEPPCSGVDYTMLECAHYCNTPLYLCETGRAGGYCIDTQYTCNDDHTEVHAYWYDSGDRSCSGNIINEFFITNNTDEFNCTGAPNLCPDMLKFRRFDIPACGDKNCSTSDPVCNLDDATYFIHDFIGSYSCNTGGWWSSGFCEAGGSGVYPSDAELHGAYGQEIGCSWDSVLNDSRGQCQIMEPETPSPTESVTINVDIGCNWVYDGDQINAIGICAENRHGGTLYDSKLLCNDDMTNVTQNVYLGADGSCSGTFLFSEDVTDNLGYFECSLSTCTDNLLKMRIYDHTNCDIDTCDYSDSNWITGQCFPRKNGVKYAKLYCDNGNTDALRYEYDYPDVTCSGTEYIRDLAGACVNGESYKEFLQCIEPVTASPVTASPVTASPTTASPVTASPVTASTGTTSTGTTSSVTASTVTASPSTPSPTEEVANCAATNSIKMIFYAFVTVYFVFM